jgi:hypothetical protein
VALDTTLAPVRQTRHHWTCRAGRRESQRLRTVRSECLDWVLILNDQHLERVLDVFVEHYNGHRGRESVPVVADGLADHRPTLPAVASTSRRLNLTIPGSS